MGATFYAVTPEMMALVFEAAKSLPDCRLHPEDIPSPLGFCYFPTPIAYAPPGESAISAVSWSTNEAGVLVTWYASEAVAMIVDEADPRLSGLDRIVPPGGLGYLAEAELPFRNGEPFRCWDTARTPPTTWCRSSRRGFSWANPSSARIRSCRTVGPGGGCSAKAARRTVFVS